MKNVNFHFVENSNLFDYSGVLISTDAMGKEVTIASYESKPTEAELSAKANWFLKQELAKTLKALEKVRANPNIMGRLDSQKQSYVNTIIARVPVALGCVNARTMAHYIAEQLMVLFWAVCPSKESRYYANYIINYNALRDLVNAITNKQVTLIR